MAGERPNEEGSRGSGGGLVVQAKKYLVYTWEAVKAFIGILIAMFFVPITQVLLWGYLMFYFGAKAYREWDGDPSWFALYAIFTLIDVIIVTIEGRKWWRRYSR